MIWCCGIDTATKSKASVYRKTSEGVCKVSHDGAAPVCTLIRSKRLLGSLISQLGGGVLDENYPEVK